MYSSVSWVPRGVAKEKLPQIAARDEEMDIAPNDAGEIDQTNRLPRNVRDEDESEDSEVDIEQVLANDLDNLSFFKRNEDDPVLKSDPDADKLFDEEELEDLVIRSTDALIVAAKSGDDVSTLEVHLFDDDPDASDSEDGPYTPHSYVHHDLVIPVLPLCTAYTRLSINNEALNLLAVGMFTPGIDIWDIDQVNNLEPVVSLGGYEQSQKLKDAMATAAMAAKSPNKKKKKPKLRLAQDSHKDAVMCLSWNNVQKEYLASGSADTTVKVWDIESAHCACTLDHHTNKVQSVAFHPSSAEMLISGSFDKTVQLIDVRDSKKALAWNVETDVESCQWGFGPTSEKILVATEDGFVTMFDTRIAKQGSINNYVSRWRAHRGAASAISISQDIPGLMVSGGVDKMVKVWDISSIGSGQEGQLVYERPSRAGALFSLSLCPVSDKDTNESPFVVAFGGAKGTLRVVDLAVESEAVRDNFVRHCSPSSSEAIMKRAARGKQTRGSRKVLKQMEGESDSDDEGSESGWESE